MSVFLERCIVQVPYIAMASKVLKKLDLSQSPLCQNFLAEDIGDLFDRDALSRLVVGRGAHDAVRALA